MLYIVIALSAEARAIVQMLKLKRVYTLPYTMFENEDVKLIISGMGNDNAMMATSTLLGHLPPCESDLLINIGICAAPKKYAIGESLLIHKITREEHSCFPDILFEHSLKESGLLTVDKPTDEEQQMPVDMESYGIYKAASRFLQTHQMLFYKVVSDHFEPHTVTKELAEELILANVKKIEDIISRAQYVMKKEKLFTTDEEELIQKISDLLSKSQSDAFVDACHYYKFHQKKPLHPKGTLHVSGIKAIDEKISKQERNKYFEQLIKTLTL
ncbi:hypothetical protein KKA17_11870 [bacterium]|nr:hypothetical protein [bacterium]MBU1884233.1 hypothetical protein [bacterium]